MEILNLVLQDASLSLMSRLWYRQRYRNIRSTTLLESVRSFFIVSSMMVAEVLTIVQATITLVTFVSVIVRIVESCNHNNSHDCWPFCRQLLLVLSSASPRYHGPHSLHCHYHLNPFRIRTWKDALRGSQKRNNPRVGSWAPGTQRGWKSLGKTGLLRHDAG